MHAIFVVFFHVVHNNDIIYSARNSKATPQLSHFSLLSRTNEEFEYDFII